MISDRELWACAQQVLTAQGADTDRHIADRVSQFARAGDEAGIATWRAIADRVDSLRDTRGDAKVRH